MLQGKEPNLTPDGVHALGDQQWHYQASTQVTQPGLIETVLPAGVFFGTDNAVKTSQLDLTLAYRVLRLDIDAFPTNILTAAPYSGPSCS